MLTWLLLAQIMTKGFLHSAPAPNNRGSMCAAKQCMDFYVEEHSWTVLTDGDYGWFFNLLTGKHPGRFSFSYSDLKHYLPGDWQQAAREGHIRVVVKDDNSKTAPIYCLREDAEGFEGLSEPGHMLDIYVRIEARKENHEEPKPIAGPPVSIAH